MYRVSEKINIKKNPLSDDLDHILSYAEGIIESFRNKRIFITGGTGFFGCWLLETLAWANEKLGMNTSVVVLTRNFDSFFKKMPHLANNPKFKFHVGDVRNFIFPEGRFDYIIHAAATSALETYNNEDPLVKFSTIVDGTKHVLDFAVHSNTSNFLFTSSGAVYGNQSDDVEKISEEYIGAPNTLELDSAWGESKRTAEFICTYYSNKYGINIKIARCFSFVGPNLPLDIHYAIGNFINDGINNREILVRGDGTAIRSYLYAADLVIWLLTILIKGESCRAYNVGSQRAVSTGDLAKEVALYFNNNLNIKIEKKIGIYKSNRYVPSVNRALTELGVREIVDLQQSIKKTIDYLILTQLYGKN